MAINSAVQHQAAVSTFMSWFIHIRSSFGWLRARAALVFLFLAMAGLPAAQATTVTITGTDADYGTTSFTKSVGGRTLTFSNTSTNLGMDTTFGPGTPGLYAYEGSVNGSDIKLTIAIENGYTFDIASFMTGAASGQVEMTVTYADGSTETFEQTGLNFSWQTLSSFTSASTTISDIKKIVLTSTDFALFQDFDITDVKAIVSAPVITSATYNAATGALVVTGTSFTATGGATNDIVSNKFTFTGQGSGIYTLTDTANAEITSATEFTLTLSTTDRAGVNVLLNKNGTASSTVTTTYNLAGAAGFVAASGATADTTGNGITVSNSASIVTDAKISISGASGTGGTYKIGDTVTATWNNTVASGDKNTNITSVTVNFSAFGGGAAVAATNSSNTWTATYTIASSTIDNTNLNVSVTATDSNTQATTTADTTNATVDNQAPTVSQAAISASGATGTSGAYKVGDTITVTWNNTAGGDNNADTIASATINFSAFGGGTAVAMTNSSGTWTGTYTLVAGSVDTSNRNVQVTATDNAGNTTATVDNTSAVVDIQPPTVTDARIAISGATGSGGAYKVGDTVTVTWNNTAGGDNNTDTLASRTVNFTAFGGGAAVVPTNSSNTWTATYTITVGTIDGTTNSNVSVSVTDNAGNTTTTADTTNATVDNQAPIAPTGVTLTPIGGTVTANTLNATNTNLQAAATITAGQATGATAELYIGAKLTATDNTIAGGDTSVAFDLGTTTTASLQAAVTAGGVATVRVYDAAGNSATSSTANPTLVVNYASVPGAPTIGAATAGSAQATVTFTAPGSDGGSAITGYTVTSSPGNITANGANSPITVTGLTDGTAYTFTVTATNVAGTGSASAASNSVTPKATNIITFNNPGAQNFGTTPTLTATASSTDAVAFTSATTGVCTITSGGALTFVTAGTCTIDADEDGDATHLAATQVSQSFTVNTVVPGAPTIGAATAGNTQATVTFTAPASNGGAAITGYAVTASPGGAHANGASSPITVTGLTNGTAYTFIVTATNSVGTSRASAASNAVTPAVPEEEDANPFDSGGTQTENQLDPDSGVEPTPAPSDIVTNLDKLDNRVGISDNGVVVILDNGLNEPVKFRDNPPDNVLISLPSQKPLDVQMNGDTMNIKIDPETPNPPRQTILGTTTFLLPDGSQAKGLQLVQGEATITNEEPGSTLGGLELSKDDTLRGLVAQAGPEGGSAGFRKTLDGAGSVSAESGEVRITVRLKGAGISTLTHMYALSVPGDADDSTSQAITESVTLTLKAGEVARFNIAGELNGVFLGSLSGNAGKTGDLAPLTKPDNVTGYPMTTLIFEGGNTLGRFGTGFGQFMNAQSGLQFSQLADGLLEIIGGGVEFYARTINGFEVVPTLPDGATVNADGSLSLVYSGIRSTYQLMLEDATDFADFLAESDLTLEVLDNGLVQVSGDKGDGFYIARPHHVRFAQAGTTVTEGFSYPDPENFLLFYTNAFRWQQRLDPAFHDEAQVSAAAVAAGWTLIHGGYGANNLYARSPTGQIFRLVPDLWVDVLPQVSASAGKFQTEGQRYYFYYGDEQLRQGFTLQLVQ